jgi:hypothetical protein
MLCSRSILSIYRVKSVSLIRLVNTFTELVATKYVVNVDCF